MRLAITADLLGPADRAPSEVEPDAQRVDVHVEVAPGWEKVERSSRNTAEATSAPTPPKDHT